MKGYNKLIIVGKGASGKDYLRRYLKNKGVSVSILHTTRPKRSGECHKKDYYFIDNEKFNNIKEEDSFLYTQEFEVINPKNKEKEKIQYGITKKQFYKNRIHILTPFAVESLKDYILNQCHVLYLDIDDNIRHERMSTRKNMLDEVERRITSDNIDFNDFNKYDKLIQDPNFDAEEIYMDIMFSFEIDKSS